MHSLTTKNLPRLACAVHQALVAAREPPRLPQLPEVNWSHCDKLVRRLRRAQLRGWQRTASKQRRNTVEALATLASQISELQRQLEKPPAAPISLRDLYADLETLDEEFEEVSYQPSANLLIVCTESIELEGIDLGPFEIRLDLSQLSAEAPYRIVAINPTPAHARPEVTHPHVMDEILCAGEGRAAIRAALSDRRLLDFFLLIASVLRTYNEDSPYLELQDWFSESCYDCGSLTHEESGFTCQGCDAWLCYECECFCRGCDEVRCSRCLSQCHSCEELFCRGCLETCAGCAEEFCDSCLLENERCITCHEQEETEDAEESPSTASAEVHAPRLGQVSVTP